MVIPFRPRHPEPPRERAGLVWVPIIGALAAMWAYALLQIVLLF
jgi:hypothetical protein